MPAARTTPTSVHRVVLVPASPISSRDRGDELVRRYRLARLRLDGPEAGRGSREVCGCLHRRLI